MDVSIVIPVYNEEENLPRLLDELHNAMDPLGRSFEIVLVDDGSTDRGFAFLEERAKTDASLTLVKFRRNFGQTAAMQAGFDHARGEVIVTMDADLQNDPLDIAQVLEQIDAGYDLVSGWRAHRKDTLISRRLPSMLANALISKITGVRLHDYGCTLKAMRGDVARELRLYGEMHRFIPAIASWMGVSVKELKVNHRPRVAGVSKYGIGRTTRVILDLITVRFIQGYLARPMQVFGMAGLLSFGLGSSVCLLLAVQRLVYGSPLADRPLLLLGVLLTVVGIQLLSLGLIADVLARTYFESQGKRSYHVRKLIQGRGHQSVPTPPNGSVLPTAMLS
ncbi:MAG TPA: glycosyltransferase family 2 protein [Polyangiaceae bacterium]|nr:glycosyltransferase family 2 protein [Polyangiaceae bacterium]